ncbi:ribosomal RNA-processing protein 9 [Metschnikowia aff. pulcherrima]|uniref:Ribosomal RNA-processing protein 9 n=1 Tax=Metschnikowia aff. pulcherrima TaxID=2163413 RepID=A0A4P6XUZ0_9ASCO|nr:ribosomal RNA-processing protein 9 [Metschnikowia aff. pulcherrima]
MAGDPFLSDPSRKRKRPTTSKPHPRREKPSAERDSEISSASEDEGANSEQEAKYERQDGDISSDEEFFEESAADKRRRLAKQYLQNLKEQEIAGDDYDAQDLDDDILARRLQDDVAENKGKMYKFLAEKVGLQLQERTPRTTRVGLKNLTGVAVKYPYIYTVSKDMELVKWKAGKQGRPQRVRHAKGGLRFVNINTKNPAANHHSAPINCVAASHDGRFVVTGGEDARLIIWSAETLLCMKVLQTRAPVNALAFRRNTDQLYAACADLRIRTFSVNQHAQLEILYGHQDNITDISALARESCVSVGSRDKTAMYWKIAEESRLTFRGGDSERKSRKRPDSAGDDDSMPRFSEGSIEAVCMVDETHFVTGSDNGNVAFWSLGKKKALFTQPVAHGLLPQHAPTQASAETDAELAAAQVALRQPCWITAVYAVPYSDLFITGSYSGEVKLWRIDSESYRTFTPVGLLAVQGCVVKIDGAEVSDEKKLVVYVATSKEHRLGRWLGSVGGRNAVVSVEFDV